MKNRIQLIVLLYLIAGCSQPVIEVAPSGELPGISESRAWLEKNPSAYLDDYRILWHHAELQDFNGQPVVWIPMHRTKGPLLISENQSGEGNLHQLSRHMLAIYRDETGQKTASILSSGEKIPAESTYFFDYRTMSIQSIWQLRKDGLLGLTPLNEIDRGNARSAGCEIIKYWVNTCDYLAYYSQQVCWDYLAEFTICFPTLPHSTPAGGAGGGGGGGGSGTGGGGTIGGGGGGLNPYLKSPFFVDPALAGNSLPFNWNTSMKTLIFLSEAESMLNTRFTQEEVNYIETFRSDDLDAILKWIRKYRTAIVNEVEDQIKKIRQSFNPEEKQVLLTFSSNNLAKYRLNILRYAANAMLAENFTLAYFSDSEAATCGSCKGNAYKHAIFRIFDAGSFGRETSRLLGEAHEANENQTSAETKMDKKNNQEGLRIFDNFNQTLGSSFNWGSLVGESLRNGKLVFLINGLEYPSNVSDPTLGPPH